MAAPKPHTRAYEKLESEYTAISYSHPEWTIDWTGTRIVGTRVKAYGANVSAEIQVASAEPRTTLARTRIILASWKPRGDNPYHRVLVWNDVDGIFRYGVGWTDPVLTRAELGVRGDLRGTGPLSLAAGKRELVALVLAGYLG